MATLVVPRSYWNIKGLYWQTYRRGRLAGPLCDGCTIFSSPELPGGDALVEFRNSNFVEGSGIRVNLHCNADGSPTGGMCASHYLFTGPKPPGWVMSEAEGQSSALVTFGGWTRYLSGSQGAHVAFDASACVASGVWVVCPDEYMIRTLKIYSPDRGPLTVTSDRVSVSVPWRAARLPQGGAAYSDAGVLPWCSGSTPTDCKNYMWPGGPHFLRSQLLTLNPLPLSSLHDIQKHSLPRPLPLPCHSPRRPALPSPATPRPA